MILSLFAILIQVVVILCDAQKFCIFKDVAGSGALLPLSTLSNETLSGYYNAYTYIYTPCQNHVKCSTTETMASRTHKNDTNDCSILAKWDSGIVQPMFDQRDGIWSFEYENGAACNGGYQKFYIYWVCDLSAVPYTVSFVGEISECAAEMYIHSELACPTTTTTTEPPRESCVWKSSDGKHTLNISSVVGSSISSPDNDNITLFYVYSPCVNTLRCDNDTLSMSYIINTNSFQCEKYLAVWENGIIEPNYNQDMKSWQFVYNNGEKCGGFENLFVVYWNCDPKREELFVVSAAEIEQCVYEMIINSTLACD